MLTKKNVRFHETSETFTYTFPCHVCQFETGRKKELEYHLLYEHSIRQSFTHSVRRKERLEEPLTLPSVLLLGLGTILYLSSSHIHLLSPDFFLSFWTPLILSASRPRHSIDVWLFGLSRVI